MASEVNSSPDKSNVSNDSGNVVFSGAFLHNFFLVLRKMILLPVILGLIVGVISYFYSVYQYTPQYQCRAVFAVSSNDISPHSPNATYYNASAAEKLTTTFPYVLSSDIMQQLLRDEMGRKVETGGITVASMANSALFVIYSANTSPQRAYDILSAVVKVYPQAAANILGTIALNVVESPFLPSEPENPLQPIIPALISVGIVFGVCFLLFALLAYLRKTVHNADDLRLLVNVPCLANMPKVQMKRRTSQDGRAIAISNKHLPQSYQDAVRALRFHLKKELDSHPAKVILVTSTLPNEGKSTVSANLAMALAEQQKKVLLIDADLRKPSIKGLLNITEPSVGLTELLTGEESTIKPMYVQGTSLMLLASEKTVSHPQALLSSPKMEKIIDSLRSEMDYIVLDTPPASLLSDAATLANLVDVAVYVVRQDYANQSTILGSAQMLSNMDVRVIGTVLNFTARGTTKHGYGYGSGYGYGGTYGYGSRYGYGGYYGNKYGYGASSSTGTTQHRSHSGKKTKKHSPSDPYVK